MTLLEGLTLKTVGFWIHRKFLNPKPIALKLFFRIKPLEQIDARRLAYSSHAPPRAWKSLEVPIVFIVVPVSGFTL